MVFPLALQRGVEGGQEAKDGPKQLLSCANEAMERGKERERETERSACGERTTQESNAEKCQHCQQFGHGFCELATRKGFHGCCNKSMKYQALSDIIGISATS